MEFVQRSNKSTKINQRPHSLEAVKNIVAIASGKGGVGKSTVSSNLAVALASMGLKVGLMDADIYGPSQPRMLGVKKGTPMPLDNNMLTPVYQHGVAFISMGLLIREESPVVWRAPMAMKMIHQFLMGVKWNELDFLLIDLPPGTGDVQITLAQQAYLSGAVIVTTPQNVAVNIADKSLKMFREVDVPILGIVENMSGFECPECGEITNIFKSGGGKDLAASLRIPFLGAIPIDPRIMMAGEEGEPAVLDNTTTLSNAFTSIANRLMEQVARTNEQENPNEPKGVSVDDEGFLKVLWSDGHKGIHGSYGLRIKCPCAICTGDEVRSPLDIGTIPLDIKISDFKSIGRYGLQLTFSDHHNTGIFKYDYLRRHCECDECRQSDSETTISFAV